MQWWSLLALADLFVINRPHTVFFALKRPGLWDGGLQPEDAVVVFARGSVCNKQPLHTNMVFARSCGSVCNKQPLHTNNPSAPADERQLPEPRHAVTVPAHLILSNGSAAP